MGKADYFNDIHLRVIESNIIDNGKSDSIDSETKAIIDGYENKLQVDPYNCDLLLEYSQFLVKNNLYSKAINILLKLVNIDNKNKDGLRLLFYCSDHENKLYDEIKIEEMLKEIDENNHRLFYWLSELNFENGRIYNALKFINKSVNIDKDNDEYWKFYAYLQSVNKNDEGACRAWKEVLRIDPNNDIAKLNLAIALSTDGKHEEANKLFSNVNTKDSHSDLDLDLFIPYYLWNCIKLNLPTYYIDKIIQNHDFNFETIKRIHNNDIATIVYEYLGDYFSKKNNFSESIKIYKKAYNLSHSEGLKSKIIKNYIDISKGYISKGHNNEAVIYLKDALEFDPENETIKRIYKEINKKQERKRVLIASATISAILLLIGLFITYYYGHWRDYSGT